MDDAYVTFLRNIDAAVRERFHPLQLELSIVGFTALALAGMTDRGTKDIDALRGAAFFDEKQSDALDYLVAEFGRGSAGALRYGMYLDLVPQEIIWLPPHPRFLPGFRLDHIEVRRLDPIDVCVSKTFSNFQRKQDRANDRTDIMQALHEQIMSFDSYVSRLDESFPRYECHAQAPEVFPRVIAFIEEMRPLYGQARLSYSIPSWMENM